MTSRPDTSAMMDLIMKEERESAQRRLDDALELLPPSQRHQVLQAFAEIAQLDRIALTARSLGVNRQTSDEGGNPGSLENAESASASSGARRPPQAEADVWPTVAQMVGKKKVKAATVRTMAKQAGTELSHAQAARKLQNWVDGGVMDRHGRGVFAFNEKGLSRYGIGEFAEAAT